VLEDLITSYGEFRKSGPTTIYLNKQIFSEKNFASSSAKLRCLSLLVIKLLHEIGHLIFFNFGGKLLNMTDSPRGVLKSESGDAIEYYMFGFHFRHLSRETEPWSIDVVVGEDVDQQGDLRPIAAEWLKNLFKIPFGVDVEEPENRLHLTTDEWEKMLKLPVDLGPHFKAAARHARQRQSVPLSSKVKVFCPGKDKTE